MTTQSLQLHEATFRAFGSNCRISCDLQPSVMAAVHRLEDLEARWSRFRADSEISLLNAADGNWVEVTAITGELLAAAQDAQNRTNGVFNSLLLNRLIELGYDRSHELLDDVAGSVIEPSSPVANPAAPAQWVSEIELEGSAARLPVGSAFDPGGIGKGMAADIVMGDLLDAGARWAMVSLGGDIRFGGSVVADQGMVVHVDDPRSPGIMGQIRVFGGAIATSSTIVRRWTHRGIAQRHLVDAVTGMPVRSARVAATAYAPTAAWADVVAKSLVLDDQIGGDELADWGSTAVVFLEDHVHNFGLQVEPVPA